MLCVNLRPSESTVYDVSVITVPFCAGGRCVAMVCNGYEVGWEWWPEYDAPGGAVWPPLKSICGVHRRCRISVCALE